MKSLGDARIGDTFYQEGREVVAEPGFAQAKPMVFSGVYPEDPTEYSLLEKNIFKL